MHDKVFVPQKVLKLHSTKSTQVGGIPAEMLKSTVDIHASILTKIIKLSFKKWLFSWWLSEAAEVSPIFKKNFDSEKEKL